MAKAKKSGFHLYELLGTTRAPNHAPPKPGAPTRAGGAPDPLAKTDPPANGAPPRYTATRLTFKRKVIEPLAPDGLFEVKTPKGLYRFTKREFYAAFPNVVASSSYQQDGYYNYKTAPAKAARFLVSAAPARAGLKKGERQPGRSPRTGRARA